jgi:hypothetical protein
MQLEHRALLFSMGGIWSKWLQGHNNKVDCAWIAAGTKGSPVHIIGPMLSSALPKAHNLQQLEHAAASSCSYQPAVCRQSNKLIVLTNNPTQPNTQDKAWS